MPRVGSHNPQAKSGGAWKGWSKFWAKDGGSWKRPVSVFVKSGGSWVKVYDERPIVVNSPQRNYQFINGDWYNYLTFDVQSNGFAATVTSSNANGGFYPGTIAVDTQATVSATRISQFLGDYPTVTVSNTSGSITV